MLASTLTDHALLCSFPITALSERFRFISPSSLLADFSRSIVAQTSSGLLGPWPTESVFRKTYRFEMKQEGGMRSSGDVATTLTPSRPEVENTTT